MEDLSLGFTLILKSKPNPECQIRDIQIRTDCSTFILTEFPRTQGGEAFQSR